MTDQPMQCLHPIDRRRNGMCQVCKARGSELLKPTTLM